MNPSANVGVHNVEGDLAWPVLDHILDSKGVGIGHVRIRLPLGFRVLRIDLAAHEMEFRNPISHQLRVLLLKRFQVGLPSGDDELGLGPGRQSLESLGVNLDGIGILSPMPPRVAVVEGIGRHVSTKQRLIVELRGGWIVGPKVIAVRAKRNIPATKVVQGRCHRRG